jgi:hypothetical protein
LKEHIEKEQIKKGVERAYQKGTVILSAAKDLRLLFDVSALAVNLPEYNKNRGLQSRSQRAIEVVSIQNPSGNGILGCLTTPFQKQSIDECVHTSEPRCCCSIGLRLPNRFDRLLNRAPSVETS